ncbi:MAG: Uma2 family endonuclease [Cyanobacteriota bacterium]|jgi:Uma2 family endonuclease
MLIANLRCSRRLGWLINPQNRRVEIYRPHQALEVLENPAQIMADILPNFCLDLSSIWSPI